MAETPDQVQPAGLPAPPPLGAAALPGGTFDGSVVMVTGGGTGLGAAIAAEFARLGAALVVVSRKPDHLAAAATALGAMGAEVLTVPCDIRDAEAVAHAFDVATEAFGPPDVLVNNAAANFPSPAEDLSPNAWRTVVDITLNGTYLCAREFGRRHLAAGTPGVDHLRRRLLRLDRRARICPLVSRQGRGEEPGGDPRRRVGAIRHPGQRPGSRPHATRRHDARHSHQPRPQRGPRPQPARTPIGRTPRARLGRNLPGIALRSLHLRSLPRSRRCQLATTPPDQPRCGHRSRATWSRPLPAVVGAGTPIDHGVRLQHLSSGR